MRFDLSGAGSHFDHAVKSWFLKAYHEGYWFLPPTVGFDSKKKTDFLKAVREGENTSDYSEYGYATYCWHNDYRAIIHAEMGIVVIASRGPDAANRFIAKYRQFLSIKTTDTVNIQYYYLGNGGVGYNNVNMSKSSMESIYPELYPDIDIEVLYKEFAAAKDSMLFLLGDPGVGKTTFMRYLIKNISVPRVNMHLDMPFDGMIDASIAYAKDTNVMNQGEFWSMLSSNQPDVVILDDLDFSLVSRTAENHMLVSNLLSFSDGVFGSKSKIIVSTNLQVSDIDPALLRPGRCFDVQKLSSLTRVQALEAWTSVLKMQKDDFDRQWSGTTNITQADLMSYYYRVRNDRKERLYIKNGPKVYSVEEKVSKMLDNKVGFR